MSDTKTFSVEHTEHAFFVLENGTRVAKRKTHNDAPAWQSDIGPVNCAACLAIKERRAK
jgi:hypothetical protein